MNENENLEQILKELRKINERIDIIEQNIKLIKQSNQKMDNHIDFVEYVYEKVKKPFWYLLGYNNVQKNNKLEN